MINNIIIIMSNTEIVLFVTCDEGYFDKAATALLSFKRFFPQWDYYIVSDCQNNDVIEKTKNIGINVLYSNQHDTFPKIEGHWPSQCMWGFLMPKIFHEMGYKYSCQIDGDIYCRKSFDLYWLVNVGQDKFFDIAAFEKDKIQIDDRLCSFINSGIVWYNNESLTNKKYYEKCVEVYVKYNSIKADQFIIDQIIQEPNSIFNFVPLSARYNHLLPHVIRKYKHVDDPYVVHFTGNKPWSDNIVFSNENICEHVKEWLRFAMKSPYLIDGLDKLILGKQVMMEQSKFEQEKQYK